LGVDCFQAIGNSASFRLDPLHGCELGGRKSARGNQGGNLCLEFGHISGDTSEGGGLAILEALHGSDEIGQRTHDSFDPFLRKIDLLVDRIEN
jgi:hypothetical protein